MGDIWNHHVLKIIRQMVSNTDHNLYTWINRLKSWVYWCSELQKLSPKNSHIGKILKIQDKLLFLLLFYFIMLTDIATIKIWNK